MFSFTLTFILFSAFLALLFSLGEFLRKTRSKLDTIQGLLFLLAFIFQAHTYFSGSAYYEKFPEFSLVHLPWIPFFGPLLREYFFHLGTDKNSGPILGRKDFFLPILVLLLLLPYYATTGGEKISFHRNFEKEGLPIHIRLAILLAVTPVFLATYSIVSEMIRYLTWDRLRNSAHLQLAAIVMVMGFFATLLGVYTLFFQMAYGLLSVSVVIGILLVLIYLFRQRSPELWGEVQRIVQEEKKYRTSQLGNFDLTSLFDRLSHLMEEKKLYQDELGLGDLAIAMGLSEHQLSEFLNLHVKRNFFQLVNSYRIREAISLLEKDPKRNILQIAYQVGFPSKSTFYDAFKRELGMTPTAFRKRLALPK